MKHSCHSCGYRRCGIIPTNGPCPGVHMLSATAAERMAYLEPLYSRALCSFPSLSDVLPEIASLFDNWVVAQHFSSLHEAAEERVRTQLHNSSPVCVDCTLEVEASALRPCRMRTRALVYIDWTTLQGAEQKACGGGQAACRTTTSISHS